MQDINKDDEEGISPLVESLQQEKKQLLARLKESDQRTQTLESDLDAKDSRDGRDRYEEGEGEERR